MIRNRQYARLTLRLCGVLLLSVGGWLGGCGEDEPDYQGATTTQWATRMLSEDRFDRLRAVRGLGVLHEEDSAAFAPLKSALDDRDPLVRVHAAITLLNDARTQEQRVLIESLASDDARARRTASEAVYASLDVMAGPLVRGLSHEDAAVRDAASLQIAAIDPPQRQVLVKLVQLLLQEPDDEAVPPAVEVTVGRLPIEALPMLDIIEQETLQIGSEELTMPGRIALRRGIDKLEKRTHAQAGSNAAEPVGNASR